jgi:hypothetical protein
LPVLESDLDRVQVHLDRLRLGEELPLHAVLQGVPRDAEQAGEHADIDHVGQLLAQRVALDLRLGQLRERHWVVGDVGADVRRGERLFVDHDTARTHRLQVLVPGRGVEGDQDVDLVGARHVAFGCDA